MKRTKLDFHSVAVQHERVKKNPEATAFVLLNCRELCLNWVHLRVSVDELLEYMLIKCEEYYKVAVLLNNNNLIIKIMFLLLLVGYYSQGSGSA